MPKPWSLFPGGRIHLIGKPRYYAQYWNEMIESDQFESAELGMKKCFTKNKDTVKTGGTCPKPIYVIY